MVAAYRGDEYEEVDLAATGRLGDDVQGIALLGRKVVNMAERSLAQVVEFALVDIEGDEDAEAIRAREVAQSPAAAAWYGRSLGYQDGRRDSVEEIRKLQEENSRLKRAEYAEDLFRIAIRQEARIDALTTQVEQLTRLLTTALQPA